MNLGYDPETKQQVVSEEDSNFTRPKKARQLRSNVPSMLICYFDTEGIVHKEFVPPGQTVNVKFYCDVLRRMRENIHCKCPDKWRNISWALHHNNAPAHTSHIVWQFLAFMNMAVIPHPPYSPDLAPSDFSCSQR
jgi:histone-lysine N-methyltransferase SETMAR